MCFSIQQNQYGFIWITTKLGADRFDGKNIRHYSLNPIEYEGYDQMGVNYLRYSPDSTLWAFNEAGLVFQYDERNDRFETIYAVRDFFNNHSIILNDVMFDSPQSVLLSTSKGILRLDLTNRTAILVDGSAHLSVNRIQRNGKYYYISTREGLYIATCPVQGDLKVVDHCLKDTNVLLTYPDIRNGRLLIGTLNAGLYSRTLAETGNINKLSVPITKPIRSIVSYTDEQIAVGVDLEGVFILNESDLTIKKQFIYNETSATSISSNNVRGLFVDNQSNLWIATYHGGVSFEDSFKLNFNYFQHRAGDSQSIGNNQVNAVLEDSSGNLWFGTNNGISVLMVKTNVWKHFFNKINPGEKGDAILTMAEDSQGNIWAGGFSFGVACIEKGSHRVKRYHTEDPKAIISTNYIYSIYPDGDLLWFGGIMGNVTSLNVKTGTVIKYNISNVNDFKRRDDKFMLVGLFNGLFILNKETGEVLSTPITKGITTIKRIKDGTYWIGTRNYGVYYYDMDNDSIRLYTMDDNLSSNYIYGIAPDKENNLWISTENGLNKFFPAQTSVEIYDKQDGLLSNQFNRSSFYICRNGDILLGSTEGAIRFDPEEVKKMEIPSYFETIIHQFDVFNEPVHSADKGSPLSEPVFTAKDIKLAYNRNFFTFHFVTPNFQTGQKMLYSYYLDGHDMSWSVPSTIDVATYARVAPGSYTFRVKSIIDGVDQQEKIMNVVVGEPWWNTVWAQLVYALILSVIMVYIYRVIKQRQEKRNTEAKIDFFVTTAHDLLTPLNLIQAPLKDLQQ